MARDTRRATAARAATATAVVWPSNDKSSMIRCAHADPELDCCFNEGTLVRRQRGQALVEVTRFGDLGLASRTLDHLGSADPLDEQQQPPSGGGCCCRAEEDQCAEGSCLPWFTYEQACEPCRCLNELRDRRCRCRHSRRGHLGCGDGYVHGHGCGHGRRRVNIVAVTDGAVAMVATGLVDGADTVGVVGGRVAMGAVECVSTGVADGCSGSWLPCRAACCDSSLSTRSHGAGPAVLGTISLTLQD